jgi:hypothetical protein
MGSTTGKWFVGLSVASLLILSNSLSIPAFAQAWTPVQVIKVEMQRAVQLARQEARLQKAETLTEHESRLQQAQKIAKDQEKFQQAYQLALDQARLQHAKLEEWQKWKAYRTASRQRHR